MKSVNSVWTLKAIDQKPHHEFKIIRVYMATGCASAGLGFFFFFFFQDTWKHPCFSTTEGWWCTRQDWKMCLTKEERQFQKDEDGISLLTVERETDVSSRLAKKPTKWEIILFNFCIDEHCDESFLSGHNLREGYTNSHEPTFQNSVALVMPKVNILEI